VDILELLPVVPAVVDIRAWAADRVAVDSPAVDPDSLVAVLRTAAELLLVALEVVVVLQGSLRELVLDSHLDIRLVGVLHKELLAAVANPVGMGVANQAAVGEIPAAAMVILVAAMAEFPAAAVPAGRVACRSGERLQEAAEVVQVANWALQRDREQAGRWESDRDVGADQAVVVVREEVAGRNQLQVLEAVQKVLQALLLSEAACAAPVNRETCPIVARSM